MPVPGMEAMGVRQRLDSYLLTGREAPISRSHFPKIFLNFWDAYYSQWSMPSLFMSASK